MRHSKVGCEPDQHQGLSEAQRNDRRCKRWKKVSCIRTLTILINREKNSKYVILIYPSVWIKSCLNTLLHVRLRVNIIGWRRLFCPLDPGTLTMRTIHYIWYWSIWRKASGFHQQLVTVFRDHQYHFLLVFTCKGTLVRTPGNLLIGDIAWCVLKESVRVQRQRCFVIESVQSFSLQKVH